MIVPSLRLTFDEEDLSEISREIREVLRSGFLTQGRRVQEFEHDFATFCQAKFAVATNSGTSALTIIIQALGVAGGTVVVPTNTFMATPIAAIKAGGRVILADCRPNDPQMDPDDLVRKIQRDTRAVIVVHIGGYITPCLDQIKEICRSRGLVLIEDAAHAHGATIHGQKAGTLGQAAAFSFFPTKVLTTAEGGMITTDDPGILRQALILREHGKADPRRNIHVELGDNCRLSELHAALGCLQMKKADWILSERRRIAARYDRLLAGIPGLTPLKVPAGVQPCYYKYIAFLDEGLDRAVLKKNLAERHKVHLTGEVYADPCHIQPVFKKYPHTLANDPGDTFPGADQFSRRHVCLPLYPGLTPAEIEYVVQAIATETSRT